jgi:CRP-like cAMP-binding protein
MNSFWGNIFDKKPRLGGVQALLQKTPLFEQLSKSELAIVERMVHERRYKQGEGVFRQGEPAISMYIIESGTVAITHGPENTMLVELHEGDFFGELALLDDAPRSASATAVTACVMFGFAQPDLFGIIERNPHLGVKIVTTLAKIIGERLRATNEQLNLLQKKG